MKDRAFPPWLLIELLTLMLLPRIALEGAVTLLATRSASGGKDALMVWSAVTLVSDGFVCGARTPGNIVAFNRRG